MREKTRFIVAKTTRGNEFIHSREYSILCRSEKQARELSNHLNQNNEKNINGWKLKENEIYHVYQIDNSDFQPIYKLKQTKNKISLVYNY